MNPVTLRVVSVNVALPKPLGEKDGETVLSAMAKRPVAAATIAVGRVNLDGDAQANLEKHRAPDKAVYAYPSDHWQWWEKEHRYACSPGAFGENLTLLGAVETDVHIGDRFSWGGTILEISQPRVPCEKFTMYTGRDDAGALMNLSARTGWYFRVTEESTAPVKDAALLRISESGGPTVKEAFAAFFDPRFDRTRRLAMIKFPSLSEAWRIRLRARGD